MRIHALAAVLAFLLLWSPAARLHAQAVFGAPDPRTPPGEALDGGLLVSGSAFGAYGDDFLRDQGPPTPLQPHPGLHGSYYGLIGRLLYDRLGEHLSLNVNASSTAGYYPAVERFAIRRQFVDASSSWLASPWRSARLSTVGTARYSQYGAPFTDVMFSPDSEFLESSDEDELGSRRTGTLRGQVQLEQVFGRRKSKSIVVLAGLQTSGLEGSERFEAYDLGGMYSARVARYGTFRAGYTRREFDRGVARFLVHHANIGGDYSRPITASRRTFVSFGGGSAALESRGQVRVLVTADATLSRELGRSWTGRLRYNRGFAFIDEIVDPLLSDSLSADVSGLLSRRIDVSGSGSIRHGTVGISRAANSFDVFGLRTRIRLALSRTAAVYADYLFFHYRFDESVRLGAALPSMFDRQTVRVGMTVATRLIR